MWQPMALSFRSNFLPLDSCGEAKVGTLRKAKLSYIYIYIYIYTEKVQQGGRDFISKLFLEVARLSMLQCNSTVLQYQKPQEIGPEAHFELQTSISGPLTLGCSGGSLDRCAACSSSKSRCTAVVTSSIRKDRRVETP